MSRKTFKFPEEMVERHKPRKEAMGVSWPEYFDGQAPEYEPLTKEDVRQIVREACGNNEATVSNEDLQTQIKDLAEQIDRQYNDGLTRR